ncbi:hypothetical protein [Piscinibacter terrae]|nr:hypothetical protein [Albitalea terrae]
MDRDSPRLSPMPLIAAVLAVVGIFVAIIWLNWPWLEQAVAVEEAPTAWLQSSMLWSCASLALLLATVERSRPPGWSLVAVGLAGAALDERFMGHERLKDWILFRFYGGNVEAMGRVGDLPILVYGLGGVLVLAWLLRSPAAPRFAGMRWMVAAVLAGFVALGLDLASNDLFVQVFEEGFELLAETLFACALLRHAQAVWAHRP